MKRFNWTTIRLLLIFVLVIFLFSFASNRNQKRKITKTKIVFVGETLNFLKQETVNKMLIENNGEHIATRKDKLDLNKLEKTVNSNQMVEKSEIFITIDGVLNAVIKQKTPIVRVIDESGSFYIDYNGDTMPLSFNFTARVPLVSGVIDTKNREDLAELFRIIYEDEFLKKNIIGINIMPNGGIKMLNRNYDFQIYFGAAINADLKFKNYKAFYQKANEDGFLKRYRIIDLRFTQQVICIK